MQIRLFFDPVLISIGGGLLLAMQCAIIILCFLEDFFSPFVLVQPNQGHTSW
jgi:hypothetical protein